MRGIVAVVIGCAGCASTLVMQPATTHAPGKSSLVPLLVLDISLATPTTATMPVPIAPVPAIGAAMGIDDSTDFFGYVTASATGMFTIRRMLTSRTSQGASLLLEATAGLNPISWLGVAAAGARLGIPLGQGGVAEQHHVQFALRANVQSQVPGFCGAACVFGAGLTPSVGLAIRSGPGSWIVLEGGLRNAIPFGPPGISARAVEGGVSIVLPMAE